MNDAKLTVEAIAELQEKNKQLEDSLKELGEAFKSLGSINQMLELENKQLKNKLDKIEQIIDSKDGMFLYDYLPPFQQIKEVLEKE